MALENDFAGSEAADQGDGENLRAFKVLRLFRLSKMLRLARIKRIMAKCTCLHARNKSEFFAPMHFFVAGPCNLHQVIDVIG